jgi:hypothetical protein
LEREKMTEPDRYGEEIRRALTAAAELVVPAGDGLEVIRKRAARRPPALAWLLAYVSYLPRQLATRFHVLASELAVMARGESDLPSRALARLRPRAGRAHSAQAWLRPAMAAAGALLLVVGVTFAVPRLTENVTDSANNTGSGGQHGPGSSGQPFGTGHQSRGASSSASGARSSSGPGPTLATGRQPSGTSLLQLLPGGSTSTSPCTSDVASPAPSTGTPAAPNPSGTVSTGGGQNAGGGNAAAPDDPAGLAHGATHNGPPDCTPSGSSSPTPVSSTSPVSTPTSPVSTPTSPVSTPTSSSPAPSSSSPTDAPATSTPPESPSSSSGS